MQKDSNKTGEVQWNTCANCLKGLYSKELYSGSGAALPLFCPYCLKPFIPVETRPPARRDPRVQRPL